MADETTRSVGVATVNVVGLALGVALVGFVDDGVANARSELEPLYWALVLGFLWVLTVYATRWTLRGDGLDWGRGGDLRPLVFRGSLAGGVVGGGFVVGLALVGFVYSFVGGLPVPLAFVVIGLVGGLFAAIVGLFVGAAVVLLDVALWRVVKRRWKTGRN